MGLQFYTDGGLLTTEELQALDKPKRIYFVVGESELPELSCEVSFPTTTGQGDIETLVCPYVAPVNGVHYYSCTHRPLVYHYLTSEGPSGPDDDTHNFTELTTEFENVGSEFRTPVIITGTIVDVELEGGFIGIEAGTNENPQNYIAVNIQDELAVHIGKEINITSSYTRSDIIGTEMWGEYLYVETYEIVEPILCVDTTNSVTISDSKYILNNGDTYGKFGLNIGKYTFVVPSTHPIYLVGNNTDQIDISSDVIRPMGQEGYTGNVVITVYEDFGTVSYACSSHGPMGGTNNLVFDADCPMGEVETPTPEPIQDILNIRSITELTTSDGQPTSYLADDTTLYEDLVSAFDFWNQSLKFPDSEDFSWYTYSGKKQIEIDIYVEDYGVVNTLLPENSQSALPENSMARATFINADGPGLEFGKVFPLDGFIRINRKYIDNGTYATITNGKSDMFTVIRHELAHILGINSVIFGNSSVQNRPIVAYTEGGATKYYYTGVNGLTAYKNAIADPSIRENIVGLPIEDDYDSLGHWEEGSPDSADRYINGHFHPGLDEESLTPLHDSNDICSAITFGVLQDIGYVVDYSLAEPFTIGEIPNHPFEELTTQYAESELEFRTPIMLQGTIVNVELEGGFIGIQAGTNENPEYYVPINIQDELANSVGKEILVTDSFLRSDWVGVEMWGTYLYVSDYEIVQPVQECFEDFGNAEISVIGDNEAYSINGVTFNSDINGTFRFNLGSGVTIPSVYLCSLNGGDVSFKITSTSKVFENTFMFKDTEGVVYKGSLTNNSFSGTSDVNNFVEYNCGELFSVNSVELKDIYTKSQPIYEGLVSDGEYLSGIQFNNFKVNSDSPLYSDVFPDFTTQDGEEGYGYGYNGGYSSKVYGIAIHKSNADISDYSLIMCIESVFSSAGETDSPYGTTTIGKVNELSELETLTNENTQVSYLKSLDSSNYGGLLYSNKTALNIMVVDENDRVGLVDKEKFNEWRDSDELSATLFIYNDANNAEPTIIHRQAFAIDDISGSTTSTIESLEIPVNFTTGENTSESTVTLKPEQDETITSSTFHIDVCTDCNITTPSVYMISAKNNSSDLESVADVKVTLTSEIVRSRVELKIDEVSYVGHLVKLSDGGVNELLNQQEYEFIEFTKYQAAEDGSPDSYERVDAWPGTEYFEIFVEPSGEVWMETYSSEDSFEMVIIELGTCSIQYDLSTFTAGPEAPGVIIIKNATSSNFEIYIPDEVYTIKKN